MAFAPIKNVLSLNTEALPEEEHQKNKDLKGKNLIL